MPIRITGIALILSAILIAGVALVEFAPRALDPAPHIVFVVLDTVRADHVTAGFEYPRDTTPFLAEQGARGVVFREARSAAPWTLPAHASMFTGKRPSEHGCHFEHRYLVDEAVTIAEVLRDDRYQTAAFSSNVNVGRYFNLDQGFDHFYEVWEDPAAAEKPRADLLLEAIDAWLGAPLAGPRFLFVNLMEAHLPYDPAPEYATYFGPEGAALDRDLLDAPDLFERAFAGDVPLDPEFLYALTVRYDNAIRSLDARLRQLHQRLHAHGMLEDTVFIVTSDHGENLGDHGLLDHHGSLHDSLLRVPLVIYGKGVPQGVVCDDPIGTERLFGWIQSISAGLFDPPERSVTPVIAERMRAIEILNRLRESYPAVDPGALARRGTSWVDPSTAKKLVREEGAPLQCYTRGPDPADERLVMDGDLAAAEARMTQAVSRLRPFREVFHPARHSTGAGQEGVADELWQSGYVGARDRIASASAVHAEEHLSRGNRLFAAGSLKEARAEYEGALQISPRYLPALYNLAGVIESLDPSSAIDAWQRYLDAAYRDPQRDEASIQTANARLRALRERGG